METYRELDTIVLLYMLIFLVADCVCGVMGTSFLVVVGQHEDSWVGFHPAPHRLDRDALYEDPCGGLGVQHEASYQSRGGLYTQW